MLSRFKIPHGLHYTPIESCRCPLFTEDKLLRIIQIHLAFAQSSPFSYNASHGLSTGVELYAARGSAAGDCLADERACGRGEAPGAAGGDGVGQDLHHGRVLQLSSLRLGKPRTPAAQGPDNTIRKARVQTQTETVPRPWRESARSKSPQSAPIPLQKPAKMCQKTPPNSPFFCFFYNF